ncbi:MAG: hypothetical protein OXF84_04390 [Bacteroidetes bacterium]|nr:hypothetical protein [Bacteroidota bacterium]
MTNCGCEPRLAAFGACDTQAAPGPTTPPLRGTPPWKGGESWVASAGQLSPCQGGVPRSGEGVPVEAAGFGP